MLIRRMFSFFLLAACAALRYSRNTREMSPQRLFLNRERSPSEATSTLMRSRITKGDHLDPNFIEAHQQYISTRQREPYLLLRATQKKQVKKLLASKKKLPRLRRKSKHRRWPGNMKPSPGSIPIALSIPGRSGNCMNTATFRGRKSTADRR